MNTETLNELLESSRQNDHRAFRVIVEEYQQKVYTLAFRMLCNEEDAKDIVQETFIRVWTNLSGYDSYRKFSTWLYAIASNLCLDKLKTSKWINQVQSIDGNLDYLISSDNIEQEIIHAELGTIILALTHSLTPKQKIVFTLRDLEGLEVEEIVQVTGLSAAKIKSNLYLAHQTMREKLKKL